MDNTHLDELVEYPAKIIQRIGEDSTCIALLLNKNTKDVTEDDMDTVVNDNIFDYQYVNDTVKETAAFIMVEAEVPNVQNTQIKEMKVYITIACHKDYMKLNPSLFPGYMGNRRDNLVRYIDKLLNNQMIFGLGRLKLNYIKTMSSSNQDFTMRTLCYEISEFNVKKIR